MEKSSKNTDYRALLKDAFISIEKLKAKIDVLKQEKNEPIAVIGLGCRFPGGSNSPAAFWRMMHEGIDAISEVPKDRWDLDVYYDSDPDAPGKM